VIEPLYSISGFGVGFLIGMTGMGGGSLMTPLLILFFGVQPATAVGTDLLFAAVTKSAGSVIHGVARSIDWQVVGLLAAGSIPAAVTTLLGLSQLDLHGAAASMLITRVLGCMLFGTAAVLIFRRRILPGYVARIGTLDVRGRTAITIVIGAVLGAVVSISSVGAGAIGVAVLIVLYPRMPVARIVGSDIAHAVPLTLLAGTGHWLLGSIDWQLLASLLIGSLPGIVLGSYAAARLPDFGLRLVLAAALVFAASKLVL
jgi:uncharacterized membrane protein YfcA